MKVLPENGSLFLQNSMLSESNTIKYNYSKINN